MLIGFATSTCAPGYSFYGSLFNTALGPVVQQEALNSMGYDFLALSHGDFHGGSALLAGFIDGLNTDTSAVMTNAAVQDDSNLNVTRPNGNPKVTRWAVKQIGTHEVGMINVVAPDMPSFAVVGAKDVEVNALSSSEGMVRVLRSSGCEASTQPVMLSSPSPATISTT
jgi:2',3'-cyclic-nucleotide 2'-phosphodiesterase (5'-nucleotidase family)